MSEIPEDDPRLEALREIRAQTNENRAEIEKSLLTMAALSRYIVDDLRAKLALGHSAVPLLEAVGAPHVAELRAALSAAELGRRSEVENFMATLPSASDRGPRASLKNG